MFAPTFLNQKLGRKFLLLSAFRPYCYLNWLFNMSPATSWFRDSFFFRLLASTSISSRWCRLPSLRIPSSVAPSRLPLPLGPRSRQGCRTSLSLSSPRPSLPSSTKPCNPIHFLPLGLHLDWRNLFRPTNLFLPTGNTPLWHYVVFLRQRVSSGSKIPLCSSDFLRDFPGIPRFR